MRQAFWILASLLLVVGAAAPCQEKEPRKADGPPKVVKETVTSTNHSWTRFTGKVRCSTPPPCASRTARKSISISRSMSRNLSRWGGSNGKLYTCGKEAAEFLTKLIGDKPVAVYVNRNLDLTKTPSGRCYVGETHVQLEMIRNGWAVSTHSGMDSWEIIARENKRGMWRGEFVVPEEWRKGKRLPGEK